MKLTRMAGLLGLALLMGCVSTSTAQRAQEPGTYYRVFRGMQRPDLTQNEFRRKLVSEFVPAMPALQETLGARAYVPALTADGKPAWMADEFALVAFDSEPAYRAARETPVGKRYGDLHWTVFDKEKTRTGGAEVFANALEAETPYDVMGKPVDWQSGYTTFFVGLRRQEVAPEAFLAWMKTHVAQVRAALKDNGMDGYVMVANGDYEAAWQHFSSREAAEASFRTEAARAIVSDAQAWMTPLQYGAADRFLGALAPGQAVIVSLKPRP